MLAGQEASSRLRKLLIQAVFLVRNDTNFKRIFPKYHYNLVNNCFFCQSFFFLGQQTAVVCSHILKLNRAESVNTKPQKGGPRPKPVPGRGCPSLKLRLSSLAWIKAHIGLDGNELADEYAKLGTIDDTITIKTQKTHKEIKTVTREYVYHKWKEKWQALGTKARYFNLKV